MPPSTIFDLKAAWSRLFTLGLIDRVDGLAIATKAGTERIRELLALRSALTAPPAREISEAEVERAAIPPAPKPVEDLLSILAEIVAISDRDHVAWRRAKALIEMSRVTNHSHQIARGDR
jgi:hypothetical protein